MKRYFEVKSEDCKQVLELNIEDGSPASRASVEDIGKHMKQELKEITKSEYRRLSAQFEVREIEKGKNGR